MDWGGYDRCQNWRIRPLFACSSQEERAIHRKYPPVAHRRITDELEHDEASGLCKKALHNTHVAIKQHLMLNAAEYTHLQNYQELENE